MYVDVTLPGFELVPFVRVGRERGTRRVERYHNCRAELALRVRSAIQEDGLRIPEAALWSEWCITIMIKRPRRVDITAELAELRACTGPPPAAVVNRVMNSLGQNSDIDNLAKSAMDSLTGVLWADDELVRRVHVEIDRDSTLHGLTIRAATWDRCSNPVTEEKAYGH